MNISELNYLEAVAEAGIAGAGGVTFDHYIDKDVKIDVDVNYDVKKDVDIKVDVDGNLATAEAAADAYGYDTISETEAYAQTTYYSSESFSSAIAGTN